MTGLGSSNTVSGQLGEAMYTVVKPPSQSGCDYSVNESTMLYSVVGIVSQPSEVRLATNQDVPVCRDWPACR